MIERAFWFGEKKATTLSNHTQRVTGGILEYITASGSGAYIQDETGSTTTKSSLTESEFSTFLKYGFDFGSSEKYLFASSTVIAAINNYSQAKLNTKIGETTYGVAISQYVSPFGIVNIVQHPDFVYTLSGYTSNGGYDGIAFLMDIDTLRYRYMQDRDTTLRTNIQANDVDGQKDEYLSEVGLERKNAAKNAFLKGVSS